MNVEMRILSYITQVGPEYNHMYYRREAEEELTQKRRRQCDHEGIDWVMQPPVVGIESNYLFKE